MAIVATYLVGRLKLFLRSHHSLTLTRKGCPLKQWDDLYPLLSALISRWHHMIKLSNVARPIVEQDDYVFPSARFCTFAQYYKIYQIVVENPGGDLYFYLKFKDGNYQIKYSITVTNGF